jgi:hypothetical protein
MFMVSITGGVGGVDCTSSGVDDAAACRRLGGPNASLGACACLCLRTLS